MSRTLGTAHDYAHKRSGQRIYVLAESNFVDGAWTRVWSVELTVDGTSSTVIATYGSRARAVRHAQRLRDALRLEAP